MNDLVDSKLDQFLKSVATDWCDRASGSESEFLAAFEKRLALELKTPRSTPASVRGIERGPHPWRWPVRLAIAAVAVLGVGIASFVALSPGPLGQIEYEQEAVPAADSGRLTKGDRVVCDEDCAGIVSIDKQRVWITLQRDTEIQVVEADTVRIDRGAIWVGVRAGSGFFRVQTPDGIVEVHGTTFGVTVGETGTGVALATGSVHASNTVYRVQLSPGQTALLPRGSSGPIAVTEGQVDTPQWVIDLHTEAARKNASKFFPSGSPRSEPHGGMLPCESFEKASL